MNIHFESRGDVSIVIISGSVDSLTAEAVLSELTAYVVAGHLQLVADLGAVDYTSSAGLRALLSTVKATRRGGGDLRLARASPNVFKVLELSGFTTIMKLYDEVDAAVASFGPSASA
ncbi:MAG: STAS domain-containing protein [Rhodanobacter sp.]